MLRRNVIWSLGFILILQTPAFGVEPKPFVVYYPDGHSEIVYSESLYPKRNVFIIPSSPSSPSYRDYGDDDDDDGHSNFGIFKDGSLNIK